MPQASSELQDMFPGMDTEAMGFLELHGIKPDRGGLFTVNNDADYPPRVWPRCNICATSGITTLRWYEGSNDRK